MIAGTWNSSFTHGKEDDWHYALERLRDGKVKPAMLVSHELPRAELIRGFHIMRDKTEDYIKIIGG